MCKRISVEVPGLVLDILHLTAVLNSCVNPIIYGIYFYVENRHGSARQTNTSRFLIFTLNHLLIGFLSSQRPVTSQQTSRSEAVEMTGASIYRETQARWREEIDKFVRRSSYI